MLNKLARILGGDPNKRELERLAEITEQINSLENEFDALSDEGLLAKTSEFRARLADGETLDDLLPAAFAAVREASKRTLGLRHFDVQMIGGIALHQGKIAEMRTGEGKTLVATLPLYLNALAGKGAHLVTVNDYLARRDARWMAPIYQALGLTVGVLQMAARTENGRMAFLVNLEKSSPHEDQHQLDMVLRREAYLADITYGTNSEFGFDYLRDNLTMRMDDRVQRGHHYAIVDEVDNILIDEARTPLIISGPASDDTEWYGKMAIVVRQLNPEDYEIEEKDRTVTLSEIGEAHVEQLLEMPLRDPERPEDVTPEQARLMGYLEQALRAQFLFRKNKDYLVQSSKVVIVDEFTGRLMPGRRWSDGLHQAVEAKEGVKVEPENVTYATITLQNYFRMYAKLAGMTGTALTEAEEFYKIYKLDVLPIPTNLEYQASKADNPLTEVDTRDEAGYRYAYYTHRDDPLKLPVYWRRQDFPDVVFRSQEAKLRAITQEILHYYIKGRPQLVGTTSVEHSERLSARLRAEPLRRFAQALLIRHVYVEKNNLQDTERAIPELSQLYAPLDTLDVAQLRPLARTLELSMNPEEPANLARLRQILNLDPEEEARLISVLQGGVPHQVLNARKHDEESQIIAKAGAFGAVTIATNMAGRGVDIKLGGELPEEVLGDANRALIRAGYENAYDMTHSERREALKQLLVVSGQWSENDQATLTAGSTQQISQPTIDSQSSISDLGIYEEGARAFLEYMDNMERVRALGGLHVIGSERHEARRIDNQLRGRAARQGDPGSSRFYLALDDDLMRLFGGGSVEGLLTRLNIDEALPIESGMVGKLVEQSQTRVEGSNFDVRKHLLEYDDVLNSQRARIYTQRDRVFTKEDLSEDIVEMVEGELQRRVTEAIKDEEGPWKLLAYLEEIQPAMEYEEIVFPNFTQRLLLDELRKGIEQARDPRNSIQDSLLKLAGQALEAEREHLLRTSRELIDRADEALQSQIDERLDALDTALEGLSDVEEDLQPRRPQELLEELISAVRLPLRLSPEQLRQLSEDSRQVRQTAREQVEDQLTAMTVTRLVGSFERRLEESLNLKTNLLQEYSWDEIRGLLLQTVQETFDRRRERLIGEQNQLARDLEPLLQRIPAVTGESTIISEDDLIRLLAAAARGTRLVFDRKTHRQAWQATTRLRYGFLAARLLQNRSAADIIADVLDHLEEARHAMGLIWGRSEWNRMIQQEVTLSNLQPGLQDQLKQMVGEAHFNDISGLSLQALSPADREQVVEILGGRVMNEIYRQLLLSVISELWVDYLTRVEALRVSIGLEAYAQRDPLVQYKSKATELFGNLLNDIRVAAISRMFTYRPRVTASSQRSATSNQPAVADAQPQAGAPQTGTGQGPVAVPMIQQPAGSVQPGGKHKKKRKRH